MKDAHCNTLIGMGLGVAIIALLGALGTMTPGEYMMAS